MLPSGYEKKSFRRFAIPIDLDRLRSEYSSISDSAWARSYWGNIHCSVGMLLLRGGVTGTEEDFFAESISNHAVLDSLPYIKSLIAEAGPFGEASYAFLFRMIPNGVTLKHQDLMEQWFDLYRIHIPIITNADAFFVSEDKSLHFEEGYAWSFNNQVDHGVVNGPNERIHLIFDVPFNPALAEQIDRSEHIVGENIIENVERINSSVGTTASYPGDKTLRNAISTLRERGHSYEAIADFFNAKKIPSKLLSRTSPWQAEDIRGLEAS